MLFSPSVRAHVLFSGCCLDGEPLEDSRRSQVMSSGDLLIVRVRKSDSGRYSCTRANEAGQVQAIAHLTVRGKIQYSPQTGRYPTVYVGKYCFVLMCCRFKNLRIVSVALRTRYRSRATRYPYSYRYTKV